MLDQKWPITMLNHTDIPGAEKCVYFYFWHLTYARATRYEEAFLPKGKKRPRSLGSLGVASLKTHSQALTKTYQRIRRPISDM